MQTSLGRLPPGFSPLHDLCPSTDRIILLFDCQGTLLIYLLKSEILLPTLCYPYHSSLSILNIPFLSRFIYLFFLFPLVTQKRKERANLTVPLPNSFFQCFSVQFIIILCLLSRRALKPHSSSPSQDELGCLKTIITLLRSMGLNINLPSSFPQ